MLDQRLLFGLDKQAGTGSSSSYSLIVNHNMPFDAAGGSLFTSKKG